MGQQYKELAERHQRFIAGQKVFFVGTATDAGRVNVSPKGMDSLRVLDKNRITWLSVTGSGNETSAHVQTHPRMTLMFCAFEGDPVILRVYGQARVIHRKDAEWQSLFPMFEPIPGSRQIFVLTIDLVQTSCGMAVPVLKYKGERDQLVKWAVKKGETGIEEYWEEKNQRSIDGIATNIVERST